MPSRREREKEGREKLARIVETCKSVEDRSVDPFLVDVGANISQTKEFFPEWTIPEDLCLDAETIHHLASVVRLQGEWVKHRSTSLYTDPFLLERKILELEKEDIVGVFIQAWHPIIALEQISIHSLVEATRYWKSLAPMSERWKVADPAEIQTDLVTKEELLQQRVLNDKTFSEELDVFWQELLDQIDGKNENQRIAYWDFVDAETYVETVQRAFMTSFLITYGYASLEIYPLEEEIFIKPCEKPQIKQVKEQLISIPIAVSMEDWMKRRNGGQGEQEKSDIRKQA